jgi:hypothetical protein
VIGWILCKFGRHRWAERHDHEPGRVYNWFECERRGCEVVDESRTYVGQYPVPRG